MIKKFEQYDTVKRWINGIQVDHTGSHHTTSYYLRWLKKFVDWIGKNPDQLIEERKQQLKSEDMTVKRKAEEELRRSSAELEEEYKRSTIRTIHSTVKSFYKYNYVPLQLRTPKKIASHGLQPHTTEEIKSLHDVANLRDRAIVLCLAESGMSSEDFIELTYGDIKQDYEANKDTIHLKVIRRKAQVAYETFFGKNATTALRRYIEARKRRGETITDQTMLWKSRKGKGGFQTPDSINWLLQRLGEKTGITSSPHRFRKFFETNMGTKAPSLLVKYWMGHSLGVESSYFVPSVEDQRKAYLEAYEKIDILKIEPKISRKELWEEFSRMKEIEDIPDKDLEPLAKKKGMTIPEIRNLVRMPQADPEIEEWLAKRECKQKNEDCQKIIGESELETWLAKGWHVEVVLPSGKIVVSNE
jgi:integrase